MSDPISLDDFRGNDSQIAYLKRQIDMLSGGGPPYDGDMEKRVAKLEAAIPILATKESMKELGGKIELLAERLSSDVRLMDERLSGKIETMDARLSGDIKKLDERTTHMPTKFGVAGILTTVLGFFAVLSAFQEKILAYFGIS